MTLTDADLARLEDGIRWLRETGFPPLTTAQEKVIEVAEGCLPLLAEVRRLRAIVVDYQQGMICRFCHSRPCHCEVTSP